MRQRFGHHLDRFINGPYHRALIASIHQRYLTISISIAILMLCVGLVAGVDMLIFKSSLVHLGANIDVQLSHSDFSVLEAASIRLKHAFEGYPGGAVILKTITPSAKKS